jgi:hypothetical protein
MQADLVFGTHPPVTEAAGKRTAPVGLPQGNFPAVWAPEKFIEAAVQIRAGNREAFVQAGPARRGDQTARLVEGDPFQSIKIRLFHEDFPQKTGERDFPFAVDKDIGMRKPRKKIPGLLGDMRPAADDQAIGISGFHPAGDFHLLVVVPDVAGQT